jgi:hypothetical protein
VIANLSCFSHTHPHVEEHRRHLLEVVDYFVHRYPQLDGIMLDYIRYSEYSEEVEPSFRHIDTVTTFVKELKESRAGGRPVYLNLFTHAGSYRELLLGQRYADLSGVCDYFCPMIYPYGAGSAEIVDLYSTRANLVRTEENGLRVVPLLRTWDPISAEELDEQIKACLGTGVDGVGFFRLAPTDGGEWEVIEGHALRNR